MGVTRIGRRWLIVSAIALTLVVSSTLCAVMARADSGETATDEKIVLKVGWPTEPDNLNFLIGWLNASYEVWRLSYDFLVGFGAGDYGPVPEIAESWTVSDDGTVWTYKLREGLTWSDGEPVTADDVKYTFDLERETGMMAINTVLIEDIVVVDDYTIEFRCSAPKANMNGIWQPILPEHIWGEMSADEATTAFPNDPPIVGGGPFECVEFKRGSHVRLVANKDYWAGAPKIDEVIFYTYKNPVTMAFDLKSGKLDAAVQIPSAQYAELEKVDGLSMYSYMVKGFDHLGINCYGGDKSGGHPALRDPQFRQAIAWAIDRQQIAELSYVGHATPADSLIAPGFSDPDYHYDVPADEAYGFDLAKANQILDDAGYEDADGDGVREYEGKPITLRLATRTGSVEQQNAGKLITGWLEQLGLRVKLEVLDDGRLSDLVHATDGEELAPDFDLFIWSWTGNVDPTFILSIYTTEQIGVWGEVGWSNAEYDRLFEEQLRTIDPSARKEMVDRMQEILLEEVPDIHLVYPHQTEGLNTKDWVGWVQTPEGTGGHIFLQDTVASYVQVQPRVASTQDSSGTLWWPWVLGGIVVLGGGTGAVVWHRRGERSVEE